MNLIKIEHNTGVEYHGIYDVYIDGGTVTVTVGVWLHALDVLTLRPLSTYVIVIHFENWIPEHFNTLFPLLATLPELAGGTIVDARSTV